MTTLDLEPHEQLAEFLYDIGWTSPTDAQWTRLRDALPKLQEMLNGFPKTRFATALDALVNHRQQVDDTGVMVGVSREALDELLRQVEANKLLGWSEA